MSVLGIERITDARDASRCEALFREHVEWVSERTRQMYAIDVTGGDPQAAHETFLAEWDELTGPRGRVILARADGADVGVVVLKPISATVAELKRMYIRPEQRGKGLARELLEALLVEAREIGYETVRLDSAGFMTEAHALYRSAGFIECPPYEGYEAAKYAAVDPRAWVFMALAL